ncbi:MAG TPA: hypothetical protein VG365_02155 [Solirubrobacteraceae bacterium]|nr:hypothetical protein [Solirubrobacteraceae bacterium]
MLRHVLLEQVLGRNLRLTMRIDRERRKRWRSVTIEWLLRTLNEIAGNLSSLR